MIAFALVAVAAAVPAPQSVQQPSQIVPAPAHLNQQQANGIAPEGAKDLQGSASIGYGYYGGGGGYPYYGGYSSFYGSYPHYGYGGK